MPTCKQASPCGSCCEHPDKGDARTQASVWLTGGAQGSPSCPCHSHFSANRTPMSLSQDPGTALDGPCVPSASLACHSCKSSPKSPECSSGSLETCAQCQSHRHGDTEQAHQPCAPAGPGGRFVRSTTRLPWGSKESARRREHFPESHLSTRKIIFSPQETCSSWRHSPPEIQEGKITVTPRGTKTYQNLC